MASPDQIKDTFIENLLYCYAISIKKIFNGWNHSHFKIIDKYNTKAEKIYIKQDIIITCKPYGRIFSEVNFRATPESLMSINKEVFEIFKEKSRVIEDLLLEDFKDFTKLTGNKWIEKIKGTVNFRKITKIFIPISLINDTISFYFEPQLLFDILPFWKPLKLYKYYKNLYIHKYNGEEKYKINQELAQKKFMYIIENSSFFPNYPINLLEDLHKKSTQTYEEHHNEKVNALNSYTNDDVYNIEKLRLSDNLIKFPKMETFNQGNLLAGKKRKREDD